jgi:CheY-like chemotaxis protein
MKKIQSSQPPGSSSGGGKSQKGLILYVEDEDENWLVAELLLRRSYNLLRARDDREACALVTEKRGDIDAILMDIQLSGSLLDGLKLTRLLRGRLGASEMPSYAQVVRAINVPIIFVTAYGSRYSEADLVAAGGDAMLPKPVDFVQLNSTLSRLGAQ